MWMMIFLLLVFILLLLPLLPAINELYAPTDDEPLRVVQEYDINIKHFATGLTAYLQKNIEHIFLPNSTPGDAFREGTLRDGTKFQSPGKDGLLRFSTEEKSHQSINQLIVSAYPLNLPENMLYEAEVYSHSTLTMGAHSKARALLAEGDIELAEGCTVLRWAHSNQSLHVNKDFNLFGRASADKDIIIHGKGHFERLTALIIQIGTVKLPMIQPGRTHKPILLEDIAKIRNQFEKRWLVSGKLKMPSDSFFAGDIVATKSVNIGSQCHIIGSIKSNGKMIIGSGSKIEGSIVSSGDIFIESGCHITGQIIAEGNVVMESDTIIGDAAAPSTVNAQNIQINGSALIYGTVWAEKSATVSITSPKVLV
jgi:cytoskeletal protein CcmA (bactofilin family)